MKYLYILSLFSLGLFSSCEKDSDREYDISFFSNIEAEENETQTLWINNEFSGSLTFTTSNVSCNNRFAAKGIHLILETGTHNIRVTDSKNDLLVSGTLKLAKNSQGVTVTTGGIQFNGEDIDDNCGIVIFK